LKTILNKIKKIDIPLSKEFNLNKFNDKQDLLYNLNSDIFENNQINHKVRIKGLNSLRNLLIKEKLDFLVAHNFVLSAKVEQELGNIKGSIQKSTKSYKLFSQMHKDNPLAVNGSIFAYSNLANIYSNLKLNNISLEYLYKAKKIIHLCEKNYIPKVRINLNLGICYHQLGKYKKSLAYLDEIYQLVLANKDYNLLIPIIINTSAVYFSMKKYKECLGLNKQALKLLDKINDVNYKPTILNDLATCYRIKKNLKKSLILFKESLNINIDISAYSKIPNGYNNIADTLLDLKDYKNAIINYKKSIDKCTNQEHLQSKLHALEKLCQLINSDDKGYNKYHTMYIKYLKEEMVIKEKLYNNENKNTVLSLEAYIDNLEKERENSKLRMELNHKKREVVTKNIKTLSENNFLSSIIDKLKKDSLNNDSNIRKSIKDTIKLLNHRLDDSVDWKQFLEIFDELNPLFFKKLNGYKNKLTELEIRVCAMIRFGFNTREIASILSITTRGVEQHRYRIKKKINSDKNLTNYLLNL
jgi:tetratricopeptide (TPR) repeat protein